jgi:8-amino-7-oxononanoate synthase
MADPFACGARLAEREAAGLRRALDPLERVSARTPPATEGSANARTADQGRGEERSAELVFASNNYLGLADDDRVQEAASRAAREVGTGAGASRLVTGDTACHHAFESTLADAKTAEDALLFSSGYAANVGTITALGPDLICSDEYNHASIVDGCRLSEADIAVYDHADPADLERQLRHHDAERPLVVTDSVFSMDGDVAPLAALCDVAEDYGAGIMVDEAHATGLYADGGGVVGREGLADRVTVQLGTCSKALASQGGYVAGGQDLIDLLTNEARSFVYSTGLAPPAVAAAHEAFDVARSGDRRDRLWAHVETLRNGLQDVGYRVPGETQILPVMLEEREATVALADALAERGVRAPAIRPPTVPEGTSRIRVTPMATHTESEIATCIDAFREAGREVGVL